MDQAAKEEAEGRLLKNIAANRSALEELLKECGSKWGYEDPVYRFYHQSLKVYGVQETTLRIVGQFEALLPGVPLNEWFLKIVREGTGKEFDLRDNDRWLEITRPIVEAFFHAKFFLEMVCKYGPALDSPPSTIPSGWAAVLYLYNLR
jgi:hypothetical protein